MKHLLSRKRLTDLLRQRNLMLVCCGFLLLTSLIQAAALFYRDERILVVPPETRQAFWVERNLVSAAYLEEMAVFLADLALSVSASSAPFQREVLLRYATPESYSALKAQLLAQEERLRKDNIATSFRPIQIKVDLVQQRAELTGDLLTYVGDKRISQVRESYELRLLYKAGRLHLKSLKCIESKK